MRSGRPKNFWFLGSASSRIGPALEIANFGYGGRRELRFGPWIRYGISLWNLAFRTLGAIHKKRKRQLCRLWMAPYENLLKCSFCPVRGDRGEVEIAIGCVSLYLYAFENMRGFVISKWFFAIVKGILWYIDKYLTIYKSSMRGCVIPKWIFPIVNGRFQWLLRQSFLY